MYGWMRYLHERLAEIHRGGLFKQESILARPLGRSVGVTVGALYRPTYF
jgi:hypothetical protein